MKNKKTISAWGFIMSALGTSIGLGGIWGFPTKMNQYGGTFLIPFLIALIVCAIPLLLVELNLGTKYRKNHVMIFEELANRPGKFFGFLQSTMVWLLGIFYSVLVAWSLLALIMGFLPGLTQPDFFLHLIGQTNDSPKGFSQLGNISVWVLLSLLAVWLIAGLIVLGGVTKGLDIANKVFVPGLFVLMLVMMIYSMTLDGATDGLKTMFNFKGNNLLSPSIWTDAFGSAFFMLSTGTGTMIIFSSYAPKNQDNANKTLMIAGGTTIVALITAATVFAGIGAIAKHQNLPIDQVFQPGPTLIFQVFPQIFAIIAGNSFGLLVLSHILAIFFFLSVFFAGISSLIAMLESIVNPLIPELKIKRSKLIIGTIVTSLLVDILFIFNNSSVLIDGLSTWVAGIWQMIIGIFELIGVAWIWKIYPELREFNNKKSWFKWDKYGFRILCLVFIPVIIALNLGFAFYQLINNIQDNIFVFLTIGTTLGAFVTLIVTAIFTYHLNIKNQANKLKNKIFKNKISEENKVVEVVDDKPHE
ncbi:MAG: sodium-dependent transporter [Spiroplasma sp.]|nr:sodium-dependent transporter [Spiroplasma sp.]